MSKLPRPLKHPRNDFESDSDFEDMPKHKARRVCQPQRFVAVSEADVDASKKPIVVKNTEKATAWAVHDMKTPTAHAVAFSVFFTTMG